MEGEETADIVFTTKTHNFIVSFFSSIFSLLLKIEHMIVVDYAIIIFGACACAPCIHMCVSVWLNFRIETQTERINWNVFTVNYVYHSIASSLGRFLKSVKSDAGNER